MYSPRIRHFACALALLIPVVATAQPPAPMMAGELAITAAWARATAPGVTVGAAYFTVLNRGQHPDALLGATTSVAARAEFHRTTQRDGVSHMDPARPIDIAPGEPVKIQPGGLHLMLTGLQQPLAAGTRIPITLRFRRAGTVTVQVEIVPLAATARPAIPHGTTTTRTDRP
jgi:copper(I)-binding protein